MRDNSNIIDGYKIEMPKLHPILHEMYEVLTLDMIRERLPPPSFKGEYRRESEKLSILTQAEATCLRNQSKDRLPSWQWNKTKPHQLWISLIESYKYPHYEVPMAGLVKPHLPYEFSSLYGLKLDNLSKERLEIPLSYKWAYTSDYLEDRPYLWSTWVYSITSGHVTDVTLSKEGYLYDMCRVYKSDLNRPLAFRLIDILNCWEDILKCQDNIDKNLVNRKFRPRAPHLLFKSTHMRNFEFQFRTNCEIRLGLHQNFHNLEALVADYHGACIDFDKDYIQVINFEIYNFLKNSGIIWPDQLTAVVATHMIRGFASDFNQK